MRPHPRRKLTLGNNPNRAPARDCDLAYSSNLMKTSRFLAPRLLSLSLLCVLATSALAKPHTPAKGSKERAAIMNAVRPQLGKKRHKPLITADTLNVEKGWAVMSGHWVYADGTPLGPDYENGPGTNFETILHLEKGRWRVKEFVYAGDPQGPEWMKKFPKAPRALFYNARGEML